MLAGLVAGVGRGSQGADTVLSQMLASSTQHGVVSTQPTSSVEGNQGQHDATTCPEITL